MRPSRVEGIQRKTRREKIYEQLSKNVECFTWCMHNPAHVMSSSSCSDGRVNGLLVYFYVIHRGVKEQWMAPEWAAVGLAVNERKSRSDACFSEMQGPAGADHQTPLDRIRDF